MSTTTTTMMSLIHRLNFRLTKHCTIHYNYNSIGTVHFESSGIVFKKKMSSSSSSSSATSDERSKLGHRLVIALVGKPCSGKSSLLNSIAQNESAAKVGAFPFTTIEPNRAVTHLYSIECACVDSNSHTSQSPKSKTSNCSPRFGHCVGGRRHIPVEILDVAGLVPGASKGVGLGNKFLGDLTKANVLVHVVDASGLTDCKGEPTKGHDPCVDVDFLRRELVEWIVANVERKWHGVVRKHVGNGCGAAGVASSLCPVLGGYGAPAALIGDVVASLQFCASVPLERWDEAQRRLLLERFVDVRFPMVLALNKIDRAKLAAPNVQRIAEKYGSSTQVVPCSALAETFLRRLAKRGFIDYRTGDPSFLTSSIGSKGSAPAPIDAEQAKVLAELGIALDGGGGGGEEGEDDDVRERRAALKPIDDEKERRQLERINDLILFRYNSTGVRDVICRAVELSHFVPVFVVASTSKLSAVGGMPGRLRDALLVRPTSTVADVAKLFNLPDDVAYASTLTDDRVSLNCMVIELRGPRVLAFRK
jgi:ribosome-binding ATPase